MEPELPEVELGVDDRYVVVGWDATGVLGALDLGCVTVGALGTVYAGVEVAAEVAGAFGRA